MITINKEKVKDKYVRTIFYFIQREGFPSELLAACSNDDTVNDNIKNTTSYDGINI